VSFLDVRSAESAKPGHVLLVNSLSAWTTAFMTIGINVALPSIQTEFRLSAVALGWRPRTGHDSRAGTDHHCWRSCDQLDSVNQEHRTASRRTRRPNIAGDRRPDFAGFSEQPSEARCQDPAWS
jgi:hypothetical protein